MSVAVSEDLCLGWVSSLGTWFHFQVDVFVFLGFKGGLGVEGDLGHSVAKSECRSLWMDSLILPQADETNSSKVEF